MKSIILNENFYSSFPEKVKKRKSTTTRTFRINSEWDDVLEEEAAKQGVSVNALVNKIFRKYALFTRWIDKDHNITIPKRTLENIVNNVPQEKLMQIASNSGAFSPINVLNMMGYPVNYDSFTFLSKHYYGGPDFARWFQCYHNTQRNKDIFHMQHNLGRGWSIYLEKYLTTSLKSLAEKEAESKVYDYAVTLKVPKTRL